MSCRRCLGASLPVWHVALFGTDLRPFGAHLVQMQIGALLVHARTTWDLYVLVRKSIDLVQVGAR